MFRLLGIGILACCVGARTYCLLDSVSIAEHIPTVIRVQYQVFDPDAVVAILPGPDGRPGRAGTDDNMDGELDDRLEMGATHSDDRCVVLEPEKLAMIPESQRVILQHGAFVDVGEGEISASDQTHRRFLFGRRTNGDWWSMLVQPSKLKSE